jgi:hypothetical protein
MVTVSDAFKSFWSGLFKFTRFVASGSCGWNSDGQAQVGCANISSLPPNLTDPGAKPKKIVEKSNKAEMEGKDGYGS